MQILKYRKTDLYNITMPREKILITGGSGLIGQALTALLKNEYDIAWLGRTKKENAVEQYIWDPAKGIMDEEAIKNADYIIHLAGVNLAGYRWTEKNKKRFVDSRVQSSELLQKKLSVIPNKVKAIVCAAGTGIYNDLGTIWQYENSNELSDDFLAMICKKWEAANSHYACRTMILRTGVVLSGKGGAFKPLYHSLFTGVAPVFGKGTQYQSWIHIDDLCRIMKHIIEHKDLSGIYNAVAPNPVNYIDFMKLLQKEVRWPTIRMKIPAFILKIMLGEKAVIVLKGGRISSKKISDTGFNFIYKDIKAAFKNILNKK
jgi:uncharacterized protein